MPDTPNKLDYAPPQPIFRRRAFRIWIFTIIFLVSLTSAPLWAPPLWQRICLLYWQHRCLIYQPKAAQLVYDSTTKTDLVPREWTEFYRRLSPSGFLSYGTPFVGEMKEPAGGRRLVVVDVVENHNFAGQINAWPRVFTEADSLHNAIESLDRGNSTYELAHVYTQFDSKLGGTLKVFAGRIDPSDPSHFTFRILRDGQSVIFDGWLKNGDMVEIGERAITPAPRPAAPAHTFAPYTVPSP